MTFNRVETITMWQKTGPAFHAIGLTLFMCAAVMEGAVMRVHEPNIPQAASIHEHVIVSGEAHEELWLGPGLLFRPGKTPEDVHLFFNSTDRKGGDSIQRPVHFKTSGLPQSADDFSQWKMQWQEAPYPQALLPRTDTTGHRFVPTFNWKYHEKSGKSLGIGHLLRHRGKHLSNHLEHLAITYSVYDPADSTFTPWQSFRISIEGKELPSVAYGQRVDLPDGDILLPFSAIKELKGRNSMRWCGTARCHFNGKEITVVEVSNLLTHPVPRGFVEPSIAMHGGQFFMTLRAQDGHSHVASSSNGMSWGRPKPWCWDNGDPIPMDQTMTKFISKPHGLFLVYTRITEMNRDVFRHRAPLYVAQIDPKSVCLIQSTESTVLSNRGLPLGNFNVHDVFSQETWVTSQEWDRSGKTIDCDILLSQIVWKPRDEYSNE